MLTDKAKEDFEAWLHYMMYVLPDDGFKGLAEDYRRHIIIDWFRSEKAHMHPYINPWGDGIHWTVSNILNLAPMCNNRLLDGALYGSEFLAQFISWEAAADWAIDKMNEIYNAARK